MKPQVRNNTELGITVTTTERRDGTFLIVDNKGHTHVAPDAAEAEAVEEAMLDGLFK